MSDFASSNAFEVIAPDVARVPLVFNSGHSGTVYPSSFLALSRLDHRTIRRSEDAYVDELFLAAVEHGAPILRARFPRAWLDVNREPFELDPKMFRGALPPHANTRSPRVSGGLGTIARVVGDAEEIYAGPIDIAEALRRIETVYMPYHETLRRLTADAQARFGYAVLVDCHSMPSTVRGPGLRSRPEIVLGDRHGQSCAAAVTDIFDAVLTRHGYDVARNRPYAGGYITESYGRPALGLHAIQIEINRGLYVNERTLERTPGFERLAADLASVIAEAGDRIIRRMGPPAEAAE